MILLQDILLEKMIIEMPHGEYHTGKIEFIDFKIERLNLPNDEKRKLAKMFYFGDGIYGKMNGKWLKFTPKSIEKEEPTENAAVLPDGWEHHAVIKKSK